MEFKGTTLKYNIKDNKIWKMVEKTDNQGNKTEIAQTIVIPVPTVKSIEISEEKYFLVLDLEGYEHKVELDTFRTPDKIELLFPEAGHFSYIPSKRESIQIGRSFISNNKDKIMKELEYIGIKDKEYISIGESYHLIKGEIVKKNNNYYSNSNTATFILPEENLTIEDKNYLKSILPKFRGIEGTAWMIGCYFNHTEIKTPILSSFGTTGVGKSEGIVTLGKITTIQSEKVPCRTLTGAQIKRRMAITNQIPLIMDDYKHSENYSFDIESFMRAIFEGDTVHQATISKQMIEFKMLRPVAFTGENPLNNMSSNNRMIPLGEKQVPMKEFNRLKESDLLSKLGKEVLKIRLGMTDAEVLEQYRTCRNSLQNNYSELDGRSIESLAWIKVGLKIYDQILETNESNNFNYKALLEKRGVTCIKGWVKEVLQLIKDYNHFDYNIAIETREIAIEENKIKFKPNVFYKLFKSVDKYYNGEAITDKTFRNQLKAICGDMKTYSHDGRKHKGFTMELN